MPAPAEPDTYEAFLVETHERQDHAERLAQNRAELVAHVHSVLPTDPVDFTGLRTAWLPVAEPQPVARITSNAGSTTATTPLTANSPP